ncbi:uncharacterized protein znf654 [Hypomesus transpacificus]|uniref:uncharacterized protein znf654 n=1 Tax=Hypomesus transpacificus TaxID=137520 RepID=UPI001F07FD48|nr:uncharacterized protein znf654 [Hypomesus transpacificus]
MAEEDSEFELEGFKKQLRSLFDSFLREELGRESDIYCARFCELVEEFTGRWQEPLPQLRFLQSALCLLVQASACFPSDCEHVQCTLSSLALSAFELLLFFGQSDFLRNPLKDILDSLQECCSSFARHQNVHLLQVMRIIREGGSWANPTLHAILTEKELPRDEVDRYLGSEMPVFLELRVRYLMANQKVCEATSLAKTCAQHSSLGRHLFFLQVYLTFLWKASHHDHLRKVIAEADAKDAVDIICYMETEHDDDELVLSLCRAFLSQQLRRGDMYYMWQLVFIWSKLQLRVNSSKQALLDQSRQLMLSSTNVKSIFPFMGVIVAEMGKEALQFCVELCTHALQSELPFDPSTKSLIYKTIVYLLPSDLEVCRACALLVFFLERSLDAYKTVFLLYQHPDQEYHAEAGPVGNHVRFEILQVLKRGLYFDPEFWNLMALRTNCLKLMSEKVGNAALVEIMEEEKWLPSYCTKESVCCGVSSSTSNQLPTKPPANHQTTSKKRLHKGDKNHVNKRVKARHEKKEDTEFSVNHAVKRRGKKPGLPPARDVSCVSSLRRSFRQLDSSPENLARPFVDRQHQHMTRLSEKKPPKRKIRKPRWLMEGESTQAENSAPRKGKKPGRKPQQQKQRRTAGVTRKSMPGLVRNNTKQKTAEMPSCLAEKEHQKEFTMKNSLTSSPDQSLEVSQPDNDLSASFIEDVDNTQKSPEPPCEKLPVSPMQTKALPNNEVIIRASDACTFIQKMHSYARRSKVKCGTPVKDNQASDLATTVTCASDHRRPLVSVVPKDKPLVVASQTQISSEVEVPSKRHEGTVVPVCVPRTDETSTKRNYQSNDTTSFSPPQNVTVHKEYKHTEGLVEMLTSVPNVTNHTDTLAVLNEPPVRESTDEVFQETIPTNVTVTEEQAIDADRVVSNQTLPFGNTTTLKESTDSEEQAFNKSVTAEDTHDQASVLFTEEAQIDPVESMDTHSDARKQPTTGDVHTGIIPDHTTFVPHCAMSSNSKDQIVEQNSSLVTENKQKPEPTTGSGPQDTQEVETLGHPSNHPTQDPEDSHLMHHCNLCNKVIRGKRVVVAHSMYHYSQDQCMFCGMLFKNNILAMMHLSEHIEKLKGKVPLEGDLQENVSHKTVDPEHPTQSSPRRGNHKRSTRNVAELTCSDSRRLRSSHNQTDTKLVDRNRKPRKQAQRVNGHLRGKVEKIRVVSPPKERERQTSSGRNKHYSDSRDVAEDLSTSMRVTRELRRDSTLKQTVDKETASSSSLVDSGVEAKTRRLSTSKSIDKEREPAAIVDTAGAQKNVCCPVEGCLWPSNQPKNRQSLLNHALEAHYGYTKPLELAFSLGNRCCSTCSRVCWSFQHYQDHIERHRATPRHPCLHQGCGARFKTGREMRRHTRRHCPLRAGCCFSGCTKLFACLWALNLHEREHYGNTSPTSTVEKTKRLKIKQTRKNTKDVKKRSGCKPKDSLTDVLPTSKVNNKLKRAKANSKPKGPHKTTAKLTRRHKIRNNFKKTKAIKKMSGQADKKDSSVSSYTSSTTDVETNRLQEMQALSVKDRNTILTTATNLSTTSRALTNGLKRTSAKKKKQMKNQRSQITTVISRKDGDELKTKEIVNPQSTNLETSTTTDPTPASAEETNKLNLSAILKLDILDGPLHDTEDASTVCPSKTVKVTDEVIKLQIDEPCATLDKATPSTSSSTTTHLIQLKVNDALNEKEIVKKLVKHSQTSREPATKDLLNILVQPNDEDPSDASKPEKVETPVSDEQPDKVVMDVASSSRGSKPMVKALDSTVTSPGYHVVNGHSAKGDTSSTEAEQHKPEPEVDSEAMKRTIAGPYVGKKPYIRPPPTSYLDEKYTSMTKRRKKMSWSPFSPKCSTLLEAVAVATPAQRQRCAKCFSSFSRPEELQAHLELKKCTSLFGFDSDEESNG